MTVTPESMLAWIGLLVSVGSALYAIVVNRATTSALREITLLANSVEHRTSEYLTKIVDSNPSLVAATAKREFMNFLVENPEMMKALAIRPGGMIILSSVFEARFSESEFNRQTAELFRLSGEQDLAELKERLSQLSQRLDMRGMDESTPSTDAADVTPVPSTRKQPDTAS